MKQSQNNIPFKAPESGNVPAAVKKILDAAYSSCRLEWTKDNPNDMDNANNKTKCAKIAWGAVENAGWKKKADGTWHKQPDTNSRIAVNAYTIKKSKYDGIEHIIVPVVMMTEGVRSGSDGPILHSSEELAHIVAAWNGIPVVINHPQNNEGMYISANEPSVQNVGKIFNAKFEDGKLKAEAWINPNKLKSVSAEALSYLHNQQPLEVSVGVFTDTEYKEGEFAGITYNGIARNYRPDHLALLPGGVGACSWEDGCGIRVNSLQDNGGKGSGNFGHAGIPGHRGGSGENAAVMEFLNSPEGKEYAELVKTLNKASEEHYRKQNDESFSNLVKAWSNEQSFRFKYDSLLKEQNISWTQLQKKIKSSKKSKTNNNMETLFAINSLQDRKNEYREIVDKVSNKLYSMDNDFAYHYPVEIYDDGFIYLSRNRQSGKETFYQQKYSVDAESGELIFEDESQKVIRKTNYEVQTNQQNNKNKKGENKMDKSKCALVSGLITNERTRFTEDNREWLMEQDFATLEMLEPKMIAHAKIEPEEKLLTDEAVTAYLSTKKNEEIMKVLPSELQTNLNTMLKERAERREKMTKEILSVNKQFTEIELNSMNCEMLQKVHAMAKPVNENGKPVDYSAAAGSGAPIQANSNNDEPLMLD